MKPLKTNKLSDPAEFIKLMVIIFVLVSVFLFSQGLSETQIVVNIVVLLILFIVLQSTFVILYKKGIKSLAFWILMILLLMGISVAVAIWYFSKYGITFQL
jgi:phosphoglycerol transferase MdoB-like AlkP superfamily enzyme